MKGRLEARPGAVGEEKVERNTQHDGQCLDGLSKVIETACLGPNAKAMFLQVLRGNKPDFIFKVGERNGSDRGGWLWT